MILRDLSFRPYSREPTTRTIAIIGAGFSGTLVAINLLQQDYARPIRILPIDRNEFGRGVAYASRRPARRAVRVPRAHPHLLGRGARDGHHLYWAGEPGMWVPSGTMFSFIEVLPLVLLVIEAIQHHRAIRTRGDFKYGLAYTYILGAAFWNFVGAGVFCGSTPNAPLINYYEHATFLTLNHAHTALFGAFGLLAIGLIYLCLRFAAGDEYPFSEKVGRWAFWLYNAGLVLWIVFNFFPIGWAQLDAVYAHGLAYARSQQFYDTTLFWQWMRVPGDIVFALGALLMAWDFLVKLPPLGEPASVRHERDPSAAGVRGQGDSRRAVAIRIRNG